MTPTTRPTLEPTTEAGRGLLMWVHDLDEPDDYDRLTAYRAILRIETEAREALAAELAALRKAAQTVMDCEDLEFGETRCAHSAALKVLLATREEPSDDPNDEYPFVAGVNVVDPLP
jgi:hypothetical protein